MKRNKDRDHKDIDKALILLFMFCGVYLLETNYFSLEALKFIVFTTYLYICLKNL